MIEVLPLLKDYIEAGGDIAIIIMIANLFRLIGVLMKELSSRDDKLVEIIYLLLPEKFPINTNNEFPKIQKRRRGHI